MLSEFSDHRMRLRNNRPDEKSSVSKVTIKSSGSYTFRVEGYSGLISKVGESVESPEFTLCDRLWQIRIFPGGSLEKHKNYVSYYIASKSPQSAKASYKLSICSQVYGGIDACFTSAGIRSFEARGPRIDGWGRDKFIPTAKLRNPDFGYYIDDSVVFKVEISLFSELEQKNSSSCDNISKKSDSLSTCLTELFLSKELADVTLQLGSEQLSAHRLVLSVRSPVFRAMLQNDMSEKNTGVIEIDDIEVEVMRECLEFMYTDAFSSSAVLDNLAGDLLCVACKYDIEALSAICESYLLNTVTASTATDMLILADNLDLSDMKENLLRFISSNLTEVTCSEGFKTLKGELLTDTMVVATRAIKQNHISRQISKAEKNADACRMM